jgi:hypothetical protein
MRPAIAGDMVDGQEVVFGFSAAGARRGVVGIVPYHQSALPFSHLDLILSRLFPVVIWSFRSGSLHRIFAFLGVPVIVNLVLFPRVFTIYLFPAGKTEPLAPTSLLERLPASVTNSSPGNRMLDSLWIVLGAVFLKATIGLVYLTTFPASPWPIGNSGVARQ